MSSTKNVIVKFKKDASAAHKAGVVQDLQAKGGEVIKDDNIDSSSELTTVFPFVVVSLPEENFNAFHSEVMSGHHAVEHVEEDGEVHTQ